MKQSDNIANLAKAMIVAQKAIQSSVAKNATNETIGSAYADLGAVIEAVKSHLNAAGVAVIQSPTLSQHSASVSLTTRLIHETGEWMEDTCSTPMAYLDPQGFGSAVSYLRRYALTAMMGLYQADDDGSAASSAKSSASKSASASEKTQPGQQKTAEAKAESSAVVEAKKASVAAQASSDPDDVPPAVQKRVDQWLRTISNASLERLETSRDSAKTTFSGRALQVIESAFEERISVLRAQKQKQPAETV